MTSFFLKQLLANNLIKPAQNESGTFHNIFRNFVSIYYIMLLPIIVKVQQNCLLNKNYNIYVI